MCFKNKSLLLIFLIIAGGFSSISLAAETVDRIVAVVNDDIITQSEVEESMISFIKDYRVRYGDEEAAGKIEQVRKDALNRLIEESLLLQEAKRREINVEDSKIEERLSEVKKRFGSEEEFEKAVTGSGLTVDKIKVRYKEQLMMKKLVDGLMHNIQIQPTQIAAYYRAHEDEFVQPAMVRFRLILLKVRPDREPARVKQLAGDVLKMARSGEDFAVLAKEYSEGPNAEDGGDMGFVAEGDMLKEIDQIISSLKTGGVSDVIETDLGYNIVKVEEKQPGASIGLVEATPMIRQRLFGQEAELILREFVEGLKKDAYIDIK